MVKTVVTLAAALLLLCSGSARSDWEIAVAFGDSVELLTDSGESTGSTGHQLKETKGLEYDRIHSYLYLADNPSRYQRSNVSIYRVLVSDKGETKNLEPVVASDNSIVFSISYDVIENRLYWTTSKRKIMTADLDSPKLAVGSELLSFIDELPIGIAVDPCRRYLYWVNANISSPTIERSLLNGTSKEVLISGTDLGSPSALAILHTERRMYWVSQHRSSRFTIERSYLDGSGREIVMKGLSQEPNGLAVLPDTLFWTDTAGTEGRVWKIPLHVNLTLTSDTQHVLVHKIKGSVQGIVARRKDNYLHEEDCKALIDNPKHKVPVWVLNDQCMNGGRMLLSGECLCNRGWTGKMCEISVCFNYCLNGGSCETRADGEPYCVCKPGFSGSRCHLEKCSLEEGYCLNGGNCSLDVETGDVFCDCPKNYTGDRCQMDITLCHLLCSFDLEKYSNMCRCDSLLEKWDGIPLYKISERNNQKGSIDMETSDDNWQIAAIVLICTSSVLLGFVLVLSYKVWSMRKRPRLRKRFKPNIQQQQQQQQQRRGIANEHCEIAIENCCNMNICETPCCEPEFRTINKSKKEEKTELLVDIESNSPSGSTSSMY